MVGKGREGKDNKEADKVAGNYDTVALLAYSVVWTNIILAGFNLMPVPPLDGHWLLNAVMPASWRGVRVVMHQN
jgi:Zn-dependent protease